MKKHLILLVSVIFTNFLFAQTIAVNPSSLVTEVGIPRTYSLTLSPGTLAGSTHYRINYWLITANIGSGTILGNINGQSTNTYYYIPTLQASSLSENTTINIPITYGSNAPDTDNIEIQVSGSYGTVINDAFFTDKSLFGKYTKQNGDSGYAVDVKIVCAPSISNPTILSCCTNNVQFCASDYCEADQFTWSLSGGTIASGSGTSCITISPASTGNVSATCVVKRSTGLSNYTATKTSIISRTARTASFVGVYPTTNNESFDYFCKGIGRQMNMPTQCGFSSVVWTATGCSITGQGTLTPTITPLAVVANGTVVTITALVTFSGGCTATVSKVFKVFASGTPPIPQGTITFTTSGTLCNPTNWVAHFTPSVSAPFVNGVIEIDPPIVIPGKGGGSPYAFDVCYINLCDASTTCKTFIRGTPAPCTSARMTNLNLGIKLIITPNPSNGNVIVTLPEILSGNYQIFDQTNNTLVQVAKFDNQSELQIELSQKLRTGIYILKVFTQNNTFTDKIIISK